MRPEDIQEYVRKQPFEPFRITLTDGRTYDVLHPELAMVGWSSVIVGVPSADSAETTVYNRAISVALSHFMQLETIEQSSQT